MMKNHSFGKYNEYVCAREMMKLTFLWYDDDMWKSGSYTFNQKNDYYIPNVNNGGKEQKKSVMSNDYCETIIKYSDKMNG